MVGVAGNPDLYYVGAADGGVFRTNDGGITWKALFQHESVASIGALAVDPLNPDIVWAGTGEANVRNKVSFGNGVYKSTDGGAHWKRMGLEGTFQISRIAIDPHHPDTVLVAAMGNPWADSEERGVYRTTDGGATWQKVLYHRAERRHRRSGDESAEPAGAVRGGVSLSAHAVELLRRRAGGCHLQIDRPGTDLEAAERARTA